MVKQIPPDEWLCPGINFGCVDQVRRQWRGDTSRRGTPAESRIRPLHRFANTRATCISAGSKTIASAGFRSRRRSELDRMGLLLGRARATTMLREDLSFRDIVDRVCFQTGTFTRSRCSMAGSRQTSSSTRRGNSVTKSSRPTRWCWDPTEDTLRVGRTPTILRRAGRTISSATSRLLSGSGAAAWHGR